MIRKFLLISLLNHSYFFLMFLCFLLTNYIRTPTSFENIEFFETLLPLYLLFIASLIPIILYIRRARNKIFIRTLITKEILLTQITPLILIVVSIPFMTSYELYTRYSQSFIFIACFFYLGFKMISYMFFNMTNFIIYIHNNNKKKLKLYNSFYQFDYEYIKQLITPLSNNQSYIIDYSNLESHIILVSQYKGYLINCEEENIIIDNIPISIEKLKKVQLDFGKKLFDMDDMEINLVKMMNI